MAGGDGHFMLKQDYRVLEGIMVAEGENNGQAAAGGMFRVRQHWCLVLALALDGTVT